MARVRFRDPAGKTRTGTVDDDTIEAAGRTYRWDDVEILPPSDPTKVVCVGRNYADHADELGNDVPDRPLLFLKGPNAVASHGDEVPLPEGKERVDYEAELAVVVGEQCRNVSEENALDRLAGVTCFNDISNRDDQTREQNWVRGKAFDSSAPMGPVLAPVEDLPDDARIQSRVNGEVRQDSTIDHLIFPIPELIAEITAYLTLEPGDVVATGTPEGVGALSDGDVVEVEVEGVGTLRHTVRR
ncbi:MAG: fumarylacetoacetate hydrolase family protein [Haloferacaceae archaeon]